MTGEAATDDVTDQSVCDRHFLRVGVIGLVLSIVCAAAAFAALSRVLNTSDETAHMDYAYQIWMGHLPVFEHGLRWHPPSGNVPPVQWESQHPPLFYLLAAPIVGPLINGGQWLAATMAGRAFCVLIAAGCVLALSWAGSLVSTRRPRAWAIAVPAVVSPVTLFMRVGGSFYIDNLAALFTALTLGVAIQTVRTGVTLRRLIAAAGLAAAGMLTEATFAVTLLVLVSALAVGTWMHDDRPWPARVGRAVVVGCVPLMAAAAASGWFYLRNKHLTGTFTGSHSDWSKAHLHRVTTPFSRMATSWDFWKTNLQLFRQNSDLHDWVSPILFGVVAGCALAGWLVQLARRRFAGVDPKIAVVVLILVLQGLGTVIVDIGFASSGGSINARYLLPALLPLGCLLAAGILALPRYLTGPAMAGFLAIAWSFFFRWAWSQPIVNGSRWSGRTVNNVPWVLVLLALAGIAVGALAQAVSLSKVAGGTFPARRVLGSPRRRGSRSSMASG